MELKNKIDAYNTLRSEVNRLFKLGDVEPDRIEWVDEILRYRDFDGDSFEFYDGCNFLGDSNRSVFYKENKYYAVLFKDNYEPIILYISDKYIEIDD